MKNSNQKTMKKIILSIVLLIGVSVSVNAQEDNGTKHFNHRKVKTYVVEDDAYGKLKSEEEGRYDLTLVIKGKDKVYVSTPEGIFNIVEDGGSSDGLDIFYSEYEGREAYVMMDKKNDFVYLVKDGEMILYSNE